MYSTSENFKLIGYTDNDNDNGGSIDDRNTTSGYTFHFGTGFVSWDSNKQPIEGMILRNNTNLKVYKCCRILPTLKTPTIKCLAIFFKKYFNFQGFISFI